jgi:integrase
MANATKRGQGRWLGRYRGPDGKERSKTFPTKAEALQWGQDQERRMRSLDWTDPQRGRITVGEWSARWLAQAQVKPSTRASYQSLLRCQVWPTWGDVPLSAVTHAGVSAWTAKLAASGLAPATVRHAHRVLSLVLALAVRDGRLPRNPADRAPLPRVVRADKRFLTVAQVADLADAAGSYGTAIRVLAFCGLRFGELAALRVRRVDLLRRRIEVAESVTEVNGLAVFGTPKSHHRRSVPIPRFLVGELAVVVAGKSADDFVFESPQGGVLRSGNFRRRVFDPACRAAGLEPGLTPHQLRHTAASLAVAAGGNVKAVQRMLGHQSAAMTLDVYSGLFEDDLDAVVDRLDEALADSVRIKAHCEGAPVDREKTAKAP